ncbi:bifunctional ADP-dependent NAD(P)H-hydrate dehydratase/NAD(P)H-hydrate epimerase [Ramlibacter solisilvae]|uniref:Bifunctional NAD(P)H-hydrate repair enzyme n=1 Tax=Ramlibacter tataouinensis TaxID=94132 RepID=A0A127JUI4_9BURK|nr:bifunctional ADP-dependent NAD(P)H-hydrate dehydratase/NAD(P)H-hydrate epimerase [Ramlibacter tataouinensis]AMO21672.1 carbohydrate kinase [Ramlibacter tataouinensis]
MRRITPDRAWPLHDAASSRAVEAAAAAGLPPHTLMQRAGLAVARLALAIAPHARDVWIACGPGNNGGDGFEAAMHLQRWGKRATVTWAGDEAKTPADARASLQRARGAGVSFAEAPPAAFDLGIDALLGIGGARPLEGRIQAWARQLGAARAPVLAVDLPSGLATDTGTGDAVRATHTLSLLTLKPGLFTALGRDHAGQVWFDDLGISAPAQAPAAWLAGPPPAVPRPHASHKGTWGDVAVIGGAPGMAGAVLLAASAALHAGAGRVFVGALDERAAALDSAQPELMMRAWETLDLRAMSVACGCGGGEAVRAVLPKVLSTARALVLDADALNAIAADTQLQALLRARGQRGRATVITPHPLEAARLLGRGTADVQGDRLSAARDLAGRFACVAVLKGSGTVIAAPDRAPFINPTGNARLATPGTGDVLAGLMAARLGTSDDAQQAAAGAVFDHGLAADRWPPAETLTASALARGLVG